MDGRVTKDGFGRFMMECPVPSLDAVEAAVAIAKASDIALVVDGEGVIADVAVGTTALEMIEPSEFVGQPLVDTVSADSQVKIDILLSDDLMGIRRWRQVNHPVGERDVPVEYALIHAADDGKKVLAGRELIGIWNLQQRLIVAQQSMEREYAKARSVEARYRMLFGMMSEAVLVIDAASERVIEANAAAATLFGLKAQRLVSVGVSSLVHPSESNALQRFMSEVRTTGHAQIGSIRSNAGKAMTFLASLFSQGARRTVMVRAGLAEARDSLVRNNEADIVEVMERMPEPLVLCDNAGLVLTANAAFLSIIEEASRDRVLGRPISQWLGRSEVDVSVLFTALGDEDAVQRYATIVHGERGGIENVELTAVAVRNSAGLYYGISMRVVRPELELTGASLERSVEQLTELVGRMPLRDIVRDATDMIERMCIEAALRLTDNNRASAAEILGVSRQSLYNKMRRFDMTPVGLENGD